MTQPIDTERPHEFDPITDPAFEDTIFAVRCCQKIGEGYCAQPRDAAVHQVAQSAPPASEQDVAPPRIWLHKDEFEGWSNAVWCEDNIDSADIEYVRIASESMAMTAPTCDFALPSTPSSSSNLARRIAEKVDIYTDEADAATREAYLAGIAAIVESELAAAPTETPSATYITTLKLAIEIVKQSLNGDDAISKLESLIPPP